MKKHRRLDCFRVLIVTAIAVSAIFFIGYKQRFIFILPGMGFLTFAAIAVVLLFRACCELISRKWPKTVGFIRDVRILRSYEGNGHAGNSSPKFGYSVEVDYDYVVGGRRYKGTRVSFWGRGHNSWKEADSARRPFLQNKKTAVYYCPMLPSWSCLAHARARDIVIGVSAAVAASAGSLALTVLAFCHLP